MDRGSSRAHSQPRRSSWTGARRRPPGIECLSRQANLSLWGRPWVHRPDPCRLLHACHPRSPGTVNEVVTTGTRSRKMSTMPARILNLCRRALRRYLGPRSLAPWSILPWSAMDLRLLRAARGCSVRKGLSDANKGAVVPCSATFQGVECCFSNYVVNFRANYLAHHLGLCAASGLRDNQILASCFYDVH